MFVVVKIFSTIASSHNVQDVCLLLTSQLTFESVVSGRAVPSPSDKEAIRQAGAVGWTRTRVMYPADASGAGRSLARGQGCPAARQSPGRSQGHRNRTGARSAGPRQARSAGVLLGDSRPQAPLSEATHAAPAHRKRTCASRRSFLFSLLSRGSAP